MTANIDCSLGRDHCLRRAFCGKDSLALGRPGNNLTSWIDDVAIAGVLEARKFTIALGRIGETSHATYSDNITRRL